VLTEDQKKRLDALNKMPDSEIDDCDAPFRPEAIWEKASTPPHIIDTARFILNFLRGFLSNFDG